MLLSLKTTRLATLLLCSFLSANICAQTTFSKSQVLDDIDFLRTSLEETHCNLYAYISEKDFEENYQQVREGIQNSSKDSFSLLEATSLFQQVISKANIGHTSIDFPVKSYIEYLQANGTLFPIEIAFEDGKNLIKKNFSSDSTITAGMEILSINGMSMEEILERIYPLISAERHYFKLAKIETYSFPRYYWQAFGQQDQFLVETVWKGKKQTHSIEAVNVLEGYERKRNEVLNNERTLSFYESTAYLHPGAFGGDETAYQQFIDSSFLEIKKQQSKHLIIDLRNHSGGNDSFGDYLVAYFADKPFRWCSKFYLKTSQLLKEDTRNKRDTTQAYWKGILSHEDGEVYPYDFGKYAPHPKEKQFGGKVFVLVNRQSHSQSAVTAAQMQDYGFATIVGEETGEYPSLYAAIFQYQLPNTQITVNTSKGRIIRVNGSEAEQGVIPDIQIRDHLLDEKDEILEGLLKKLKEQ